MKQEKLVNTYTGWLRRKDYAEYSCSGGPDWRLEIVDNDGKIIAQVGDVVNGTIFERFVGKYVSICITDVDEW